MTRRSEPTGDGIGIEASSVAALTLEIISILRSQSTAGARAYVDDSSRSSGNGTGVEHASAGVAAAVATDVRIATSAHALSACLRTPQGDGPWPGLVVLHDAFGQTIDSRRQVDWLAGAGYLAIAPDLFSWGAKPLCILAAIRDLRAGRGKTFDDIEGVRRELARRADCTGNVGVIGFCLGGGFALLAAAGRGFAVSSVNYGIVPKDAGSLLQGACPVVGSFGGRDPQLKGAAARLDSALAADGIAHDVKEYADAGHGFLNAHEGRLGWMVRKVGMGYHDASASDAKARILAFFRTHLH